MILQEIIDVIEKHFPPESAYEWDNSGLLAGGLNRDIKNVLVTLDVTEETVREAAERGAEMILSHHPILFSGTKRITEETPEGRIILEAAKYGISIYAAHTNCDVAEDGINAYLAGLLGLEDAEPVEENGLGRIGNLAEPVTLAELARGVKKLLNTPYVRVCGNRDKTVRCIAVGSGACADIIPAAAKKGAEVMITGDTKYHEALDAVARGICVIDAGHYPTEIAVRDIFAQILAEYPVGVIKSESSDIFIYI